MEMSKEKGRRRTGILRNPSKDSRLRTMEIIPLRIGKYKVFVDIDTLMNFLGDVLAAIAIVFAVLFLPWLIACIWGI